MVLLLRKMLVQWNCVCILWSLQWPVRLDSNSTYLSQHLMSQQVCPTAANACCNLVLVSSQPVSGLDYNPPSTSLTFGQCETRQCFSLEIIEDDLMEGTESFDVTLDTYPKLTIPRVYQVHIFDDDSM